MNLWKKSRTRITAVMKQRNAEILEVYTRWLKGEKLSRKQKRLLKSSQDDTLIGNLKPIINFAHYGFRQTESVLPRPGAKQRIADELKRRISRNDTENLPVAMQWQPAYSMDPVGSDSELAHPPDASNPPTHPNQQVDPSAETVIIGKRG